MELSGSKRSVLFSLVDQTGDRSYNLICDEDFVAANIFMFFSAGYDSSAKVCTFCLFELAANETIQNKAREEVIDVLKMYDGNLTLDAIQKMTYLEQVVAETNRKYPILSVIFRKCDKRYQMPDGGIIESGVPIIIPSSAIHFDPNYYPNPDKFDPERFNEENKQNIHPSTYLPFGMGPRICVAWQFAVIEIKVIVARILSQYKISLHQSNNEYPLKLQPKAFLLTSQNDIHINAKKNEETVE
ncbi:putative cytochrome P450 6a13 isoform X2 [Lycorma delicatula]|uniref:putative cytochrome P450 6a13 isoform X2 n=1 Tax=Lycorma delicatula TaxID=130591 RepID=UPI003F513132